MRAAFLVTVLSMLLNGCIVIPLAAMISAKLAFEGHKAAECEKSPDRCCQ